MPYFISGIQQGLIDRDGVIKIEPKHQEIKINDDGSVYIKTASDVVVSGRTKQTSAKNSGRLDIRNT